MSNISKHCEEVSLKCFEPFCIWLWWNIIIFTFVIFNFLCAGVVKSSVISNFATSKVWIVLCQSLTALSGILPWPKYSAAGLVCKISMMFQPQISGFLVKKTTNETVDPAAREKFLKTENQNIFVQSMKRRLLEPKACSNSNAKQPIQKTIHVNQPKEDCTNELCVSTLNFVGN